MNLAGIKKTDSVGFYGLGDGDVESDMIRIILNSGYTGPIGIINHDENRDAMTGLMKEMEGLERVLRTIENGKGGS